LGGQVGGSGWGPELGLGETGRGVGSPVTKCAVRCWYDTGHSAQRSVRRMAVSAHYAPAAAPAAAALQLLLPSAPVTPAATQPGSYPTRQPGRGPGPPRPALPHLTVPGVFPLAPPPSPPLPPSSRSAGRQDPTTARLYLLCPPLQGLLLLTNPPLVRLSRPRGVGGYGNDRIARTAGRAGVWVPHTEAVAALTTYTHRVP
jgi:hypothetical protein